MEMYARLVSAKKTKFIPIERPFSNFRFIDDYFPDIPPLRRILSQVRQHNGRTMVIESLEDSQEISEENEDLTVRYNLKPMSRTYRLSFFSTSISNPDELLEVTDSDFIGYVLIKADDLPGVNKCSRIYESVIKLSLHSNNFARGMQRWECRVGENIFRVKGYLYAQQNNMTNVCAHVALRSAAASFHKSGDMSYREMNKLIGIDHKKKKTGGPDGEGLNPIEMVSILKEAGASCFVGDYTTPSTSGYSPPPFQKYVYGSIESGYPAIIFFGCPSSPGNYHAIPVFGHTFNQDTWVHRADSSYFRVTSGITYLSSESWVSMYLAHDDNWGSNFCIPRRYLYTRPHCDKLTGKAEFCQMKSEGVVYVLATFPGKIELGPIEAEMIGSKYLFTILKQTPNEYKDSWERRLDYYIKINQLVIRPVLIKSSSYPEHLRKLHDWEGKAMSENFIRGLAEHLGDEYLWMIELSVPELYSANYRKIGEVLLRAETKGHNTSDFNNFILARLPSVFIHCNGLKNQKPNLTFTPSEIVSHVQLYGCEKNF